MADQEHDHNEAFELLHFESNVVDRYPCSWCKRKDVRTRCFASEDKTISRFLCYCCKNETLAFAYWKPLTGKFRTIPPKLVDLDQFAKDNEHLKLTKEGDETINSI